MGTHILRRQLVTAFNMGNVKAARSYLDSVEIRSPALSEVNIRPVVHEKFRGSWVASKNAEPRLTVLYLHGGGYCFYPQAYANFIALTTLAANSRTFALDYCLSPEHRFPAQLHDGLNAYRWLLENGTDPEELVLFGDSAGGNLALAMLLAARDAKLTLPALAIALSPATDLETDRTSMVANQDFDWIHKRMLTQWADWFCDSAQHRDPLVAPLWADLRGLPPIYLQAGRCEILYDSVQAFAERARSQGANVVLESWEDMNHDFQIFGPDVPQSAEAFRRIREVIARQVRCEKRTQSVSTVGR
jgi:acetyl esterase/lipase